MRQIFEMHTLHNFWNTDLKYTSKEWILFHEITNLEWKQFDDFRFLFNATATVFNIKYICKFGNIWYRYT